MVNGFVSTKHEGEAESLCPGPLPNLHFCFFIMDEHKLILEMEKHPTVYDISDLFFTGTNL